MAVALTIPILFPESEIVPIIGSKEPVCEAKAWALNRASGKKRTMEIK